MRDEIIQTIRESVFVDSCGFVTKDSAQKTTDAILALKVDSMKICTSNKKCEYRILPHKLCDECDCIEGKQRPATIKDLIGGDNG